MQKTILILLASILFIGWLIGLFFHLISGLLHILVVLAVIVLIIALLQRR